MDKKTERIWYYDLSHVKMGKKSPMTLAHFGWGKNGEVLDDAALPASLIGDWRKQKDNADKPFPTFVRMLAKYSTPEAESDFSWTMDFAARCAKAREEMAPHLLEVEKLKNETVVLKDKLAALKKTKADSEKLKAVQDALVAVEKAMREAQAKADAIDAAVYDLKAVNPRVRVERDTRTVPQILDSIASQNQVLCQALERLRSLAQ